MQNIARAFPGWDAVERIGKGSFGTVYWVVGPDGEAAAVKIVAIPSSSEEVFDLRQMGYDTCSIRQQFRERADAVMAEVDSMERVAGCPNVVRAEDHRLIERTDGVGWDVYIRMELLEPLSGIIGRDGIPDQAEAARIGADVCTALRACHSAGIIHRDVKPSNVFRGLDGSYKLGDFGLSRYSSLGSTSTKSVAGTPAYMAPEVRDRHYDASADTYSLGVMLYRWLNGGRPPFVAPGGVPGRAELEAAEARRLRGEQPPAPAGPGVDPELAAMVLRAVEPNPTDRWPSAAEMGIALAGWLWYHGGTGPGWGSSGFYEDVSQRSVLFRDGLRGIGKSREEGGEQAREKAADRSGQGENPLPLSADERAELEALRAEVVARKAEGDRLRREAEESAQRLEKERRKWEAKEASGKPAEETARKEGEGRLGSVLGEAAADDHMRFAGTSASASQRDVVAVSAGRGHAVILHSDGTVRAMGDNTDGQCDVSAWDDVMAVSAGYFHTVGLRSDGTVLAIGRNNHGQCDVSGWADIVTVSAGDFHTVGLRSDGTVLATGWNGEGQCDVSGWADVVAVSASCFHTVGLRSDGTVLATGWNNYHQCDVSGWTDIIAVSAGTDHTVGLRSNRTVLAVGWKRYGRCDVSVWADVVAVSAGKEHTVGLRSNGTVLATGWNNYHQCDVSGWGDVKLIAAGSYDTVAVRSDGTILHVGSWHE